jgi:aspartate/methionine/tyrosine aminotransferase
VFSALPEYPWKALKPFSDKAALHPDGAIDLSVGSPIDPTPNVIQQALKDFSKRLLVGLLADEVLKDLIPIR